MEVLSSRVLLYPSDFESARAFYESTLGLHIYREWSIGVVFFLGGGFLELSGTHADSVMNPTRLWLQVRDVTAEQERLASAGLRPTKPVERMPWGLIECWLPGPDDVEIRLIEVPPDHPLRGR